MSTLPESKKRIVLDALHPLLNAWIYE